MLVIALLAEGAQAQVQAAPTPGAPHPADTTSTSEQPAGDIVVTGSRIPRAGFDTLQPAQTVSSQLLADRSPVNVADTLNVLSAFGTPGSNNTGQQSSANVGQQFVNLYNLGSQRSLVLVNGQRFVSGNAPTPPGKGPLTAQWDFAAIRCSPRERQLQNTPDIKAACNPRHGKEMSDR